MRSKQRCGGSWWFILLLALALCFKYLPQPRTGARVAVVTAVIGDYEQSLKLPMVQTVPVDYYVYTDRGDLATYGIYNLVDSEKYRLGIDATDRQPGHVNSMLNNNHTFNRAKFFKLNLQRLPEVAAYDVVIWLDGAAFLSEADAVERVLSLFAAGVSPFIVYGHARKDLEEELKLSVAAYPKYTSTSWLGQMQPFQDVEAQFAVYAAEGYSTCWFNELTDGHEPMFKFWPLGLATRPYSGVFLTTFFAVDRRSLDTHRIMELWWQQNLQYTTQDQLSLPYVFFKLGMLPHELDSSFCKLFFHAHHGTKL